MNPISEDVAYCTQHHEVLVRLPPALAGVAEILIQTKDHRMNKRNLALSLATGLLGGLISHYISPQLVHAQSQPPTEIKAQSFSLVNPDGVTLGTFSFDAQGRPRIVLKDQAGHPVWTVDGEHNWTYGRLDPK